MGVIKDIKEETGLDYDYEFNEVIFNTNRLFKLTNTSKHIGSKDSYKNNKIIPL